MQQRASASDLGGRDKVGGSREQEQKRVGGREKLGEIRDSYAAESRRLQRIGDSRELEGTESEAEIGGSGREYETAEQRRGGRERAGGCR
jgi:hypothetical protein